MSGRTSPTRVGTQTARASSKDGGPRPAADDPADRPLHTPRPRRPQPGPSKARRVVTAPQPTHEAGPTPAAAVRQAATPEHPTAVGSTLASAHITEVVTPQPTTAVTTTKDAAPQDAATSDEALAVDVVGSVDPVRQELVERARGGDAAAFGEIYELYVDAVFRYVYYRTSDRALAEDLTSETFLRAWRRIDSFTWQGRDIGAWLVRICRNLLYDNVKSSRYRLEVTTADLAEPSEPSPDTTEQQVLDADTATQLLAGISRLSPEQQECLVLRFFEGLSVAETAAVMDRREGAVKALQHRAVRRLGLILPAGLAS